MDNYGNEINQKMRSAVKAKLVELGTGGSSGYIDDELPDYVMIMVANKRSKQQMISDLNLFLDNQTELFVTWLHEVLQKLQEVTLPAASASSKKRKSSQKEDSVSAPNASGAKKDKKQAKKDKILPSKKPKEGTSSTTPDKTSSSKVVSSITDLVAGELLEKAKQSINATADATQNIKKSKHKRSSEELNSTSTNPNSETQKEFDIPTISEISSTTGASTHAETTKETAVVSGNREKDLAELAEIQKKIYAAKKQLKQIGEIEDDDEDFLNLRDEDSREEFNEAGDLVRKPSVTPPQNLQKHKEKSPIVFEGEKTKHRGDDDEEVFASKRKRFTPPPLNSAATNVIFDSSAKDEAAEFRNEKRSVHQRLGMKNNSSSSRENTKTAQPLARERRRNLQEQELYVPAFRRKEMERERERGQERSHERERERERNQGGDRGRERERERERSDRDIDRPRDPDHSTNLTRGRPRVRRSFEERDKRRSTSENHNEERNSSQVGKISTTTPSTTNRARSSSKDEASPDVSGTRKRIGSRVIVAPSKPAEISDEDLIDKPVNSVIKIKPRPPVSPSKQAPKNLLLRAVAEAQRSTILKKPSANTKPKVSLRLGDKINAQRNTKLYTKSFRDRIKTAVSVGALFTRTTKNIIVEVNDNSVSEKPKFNSAAASYHNVVENEEYIPETISDRGDSDQDYVYVPQAIHQQQASDDDELNENLGDHTNDEDEIQENVQKTQFVVTLNENKALPKLKRHNLTRYSRSLSPPPQVSSSSSNSKDREKYPEPTSTSNPSVTSRKSNIRERLSMKSSSSSNERRSSSLMRQEASTTPPPKRTEFIEIYRKPKEIKKIIIKNDSEDEELVPSKKHSPEKERKLKRRSNESQPPSQSSHDREHKSVENRSTTPPLKEHYKERHKESLTPSKRKHVPIKFDLKEAKDSRNARESPVPNKKRRSLSHDNVSRDHSRDRDREWERDRDRERHSSLDRREEKHKISIRNAEAKKYDNIPTSLNSVPVDSSGSFRNSKPKERCKYHPNCTKSFCEFYHPTSVCKSFPNCKFADKCLYSHPRCKYDLACVNLDCNFSHSGPRSASLLEPTAPPISSSVVPVQNYKSISSTAITGPVSSTTCKFFPNCTKTSCPFYHPKPCRYGKNCINKLECLYYHHEIPSSSKFKWIASAN
ncbi:zinc finger CCCH domain-containing protein 14 [Calliphora vicina]|uniref:zinc finger CCCH domain-containing protein 14 n=1 Tax=Calliphora vicina TaxID=7373 RepID=UPI00325BAE27